ncbi:hypothetical protein ABIC22_004615 [Paenibacillus sp. PvP094]
MKALQETSSAILYYRNSFLNNEIIAHKKSEAPTQNY